MHIGYGGERVTELASAVGMMELPLTERQGCRERFLRGWAMRSSVSDIIKWRGL